MLGICACKAGELKRHFLLLFPPVFSILFTIILHAQPETVGLVFGIRVLIFPNVLSDCG